LQSQFIHSPIICLVVIVTIFVHKKTSNNTKNKREMSEMGIESLFSLFSIIFATPCSVGVWLLGSGDVYLFERTQFLENGQQGKKKMAKAASGPPWSIRIRGGKVEGIVWGN
jgi:hypothetical protein